MAISSPSSKSAVIAVVVSFFVVAADGGSGGGGGGGGELVENVEVPLPLGLPDQAHFFKQEGPDLRPHEVRRSIKLNLNEFSEAARVVIANRARVSERFQDRVRLHHLLLQRLFAAAHAHASFEPTTTATRVVALRFAHRGKVLHHDLGGLRFPRPRLPRH
eukprot:CAMPEP_0171757432 /NCGR_PEP_ID=MMETSP0991-20121206/45671_1 /TAXON_ID=483369 /ORGANISM="non described non described, Strain CCMP2098" /LENGTH=160 /DNA_ID=CAMNT_0012359931 /DNA_START=179 /DNA_END=661 /DNA_ORIENTATION=-